QFAMRPGAGCPPHAPLACPQALCGNLREMQIPDNNRNSRKSGSLPAMTKWPRNLQCKLAVNIVSGLNNRRWGLAGCAWLVHLNLPVALYVGQGLHNSARPV